MKEQFQVVVLTLEGGKRCVFSGPPQIDPDLSPMPLIVDIEVGRPKELPEGYEWGKMEKTP